MRTLSPSHHAPPQRYEERLIVIDTRLMARRLIIRSLMIISLTTSAMISGHSFIVSMGHAACFLAYDTAAPLPQGDALGRLSAQGGSHGFASHLGGRLGLSGDRELQIRGGSCQRSSLWGGAFALGISQRFMAHQSHEVAPKSYLSGPVDIALRASIVSFMADQDDGARTDVGFQPVLLVSYPIALDQRRQGSITLSVGMSVASYDRRKVVQIERQLDMIEEERLSSTWRWREIIALGVNLEVVDHLPLALELRWQDRGFMAGASVAYQF